MPQTKTGSLTLSRVTDGAPGDTTITHMAYQNAADAPAVPTTSSIGADGLLENSDLDNSWTAAQTTPTSSQVTWVTSRIFLQTAGTGNFVGQGAWTPAAQVSGSGGNSTFTASIFIRTNTPPTVAPSGTSSSYNFSTNVLSGVPTGFFAAIPTGTNPLYISSGTFSAAGTGTDTGVTWTVPALFAVQGSSGTRGPGRFNRTYIDDTPNTVGSTDYNIDALRTVCNALGGHLGADDMGGARTATTCYTTTTLIDTAVLSGSAPVAGDIVVITYFPTGTVATPTGTPATRGSINDGTGAGADDNWTTFAVQIDGNLLVAGTVVADSLTIGRGGGFYVDANGNVTLRQITVTDPPTFVSANTYTIGQGVNVGGVSGVGDYICVGQVSSSGNREGCLGSDLDASPPGVGETTNGWALFDGSTPPETSFIARFSAAETAYSEDALVFHDGNMHYCNNSGGCNGSTEVPGVSTQWTQVVGGQEVSTISRMVIDTTRIRVFEDNNERITLGDLGT